MGALIEAVLFILKTVAGFLSMLLLLRFYMQAFRVSFRNQVGAFVLQTTNWLVLPLRRFIPGAFGLDLTSLLAAYAIQALVLVALIAAQGGVSMITQGGLALLIVWQSALELLRSSIYLLIGLLIVQAVLSWVNPYSPLGGPVNELTRPFLRPIQRVIPPIANVDLSPLVVILLAQLVLRFL